MLDTPQQIYLVVILGGVLFLVVALFLIAFLFLHQRKLIEHKQKMAELELEFQKAKLESQLEVREDTLRYIGRELHDNLGQNLALIKILLGKVKDGPLVEAKMLLNKSMKDLRQLSREMNLDWAEENSLKELIEQTLDRIQKAGNHETQIQTNGDFRLQDATKRLFIYRMVQESLSNIIRHAEADKIEVTLTKADSYTIHIRDNGQGFSPNNHPTGSGIKNMMKRAEMVGASIHIHSEPKKGTDIFIRWNT